ncbi:efflux RND transporter permease subunit [Escherichia coli]
MAQYPTIAPPAVTISASYPGADAKTVQDTVTQVIEQNMNGIDNLMYMSSNSDSTGTVDHPGPLSLVLMRISRRFRCRTNCSWRCRCCRKKFSSKG